MPGFTPFFPASCSIDFVWNNSSRVNLKGVGLQAPHCYSSSLRKYNIDRAAHCFDRDASKGREEHMHVHVLCTNIKCIRMYLAGGHHLLQPQAMCTERQFCRSGTNFWELHSHPPSPATPPSLTPAELHSANVLWGSLTTFHQSKYASVNVTTMHVKARVVSRLELNIHLNGAQGPAEVR